MIRSEYMRGPRFMYESVFSGSLALRVLQMFSVGQGWAKC